MNSTLGFLDPITLSALAPMATGLLSNMAPKRPTPSSSSKNSTLETLLKLERAKKTNTPVRIVQAPPRSVAQTQSRAIQPAPVTRSMVSNTSPMLLPQNNAPAPKTDNSKVYLYVGLGAVALGGVYLLSKGKR